MVKGDFIWDSQAGRLRSAETKMKIETELDSPLGRMHLAQDMTSSVAHVPTGAEPEAVETD